MSKLDFVELATTYLGIKHIKTVVEIMIDSSQKYIFGSVTHEKAMIYHISRYLLIFLSLCQRNNG